MKAEEGRVQGEVLYEWDPDHEEGSREEVDSARVWSDSGGGALTSTRMQTVSQRKQPETLPIRSAWL